MHALFNLLGVPSGAIEKRFMKDVFTALCSTLSQWALLTRGRKGDVTVTMKRLHLLQIVDGYPLQLVHLVAENAEAPVTIIDKDAIATHRDL